VALVIAPVFLVFCNSPYSFLVHTNAMATGKEKDKANETDQESAPVKAKAKAKPPKEEKPAKEEKGVLAAAAEAIGSALGTIAKTAGVKYTGEKQVSQKIPKLQKKDKHRVPRKEKKKAAKALGSSAKK
jgi:hypothetical protein